MRLSQFPLTTLKEAPSDAEIVSHQLMLRAGMIRKLAAGLYTWMPLGLRVLRRIERTVREEMDAIGALEVLMPIVQPAELWEETGRWDKFGPQLLKAYDRHERPFCLGPTHEEVITDIARRELKSYRQLPVNLYQIQTKFRDEIRPRFGVMRSREFIMKDAYSFHLDAHSLGETYQRTFDAYQRIFSRLGLRFRAVEADTGAIGGSVSHEFHVLADSGEDVIAFAPSGRYAANVEKVPTRPLDGSRPDPSQTLKRVETPGVHTIDQLGEFLGVPPQRCLKTLVVAGRDGGLVAIVLRGDHTLNEVKAEQHPMVATPLRMASDEELRTSIGVGAGSIGPAGLALPKLVDHAAAAVVDGVCGANVEGIHFTGFNWGRDESLDTSVDLRNAVPGDPSPEDGTPLEFVRGIEVGHIFQLGDRYSSAMGATVLTDAGESVTPVMGCYGIGISRIVAAAIEQNHDARGICWPEALAPFDVAIVPIGADRSEEVTVLSGRLHDRLEGLGYRVLLEDRNVRPGVSFADFDLIGIPHRFVIGDKGLAKGMIEYKYRRADAAEDIPVASVDSIDEFLESQRRD